MADNHAPLDIQSPSVTFIRSGCECVLDGFSLLGGIDRPICDSAGQILVVTGWSRPAGLTDRRRIELLVRRAFGKVFIPWDSRNLTLRSFAHSAYFSQLHVQFKLRASSCRINPCLTNNTPSHAFRLPIPAAQAHRRVPPASELVLDPEPPASTTPTGHEARTHPHPNTGSWTVLRGLSLLPARRDRRAANTPVPHPSQLARERLRLPQLRHGQRLLRLRRPPSRYLCSGRGLSQGPGVTVPRTG